MGFYTILSVFAVVSIIAAVYSYKQTQKFFNSTIDGFLHYPNGFKFLIIPHIIIPLFSVIVFFVYITIFENHTINLKIFFTAAVIIFFMSIINYGILFFLYILLKKRLREEGYIPLSETDGEYLDSKYTDTLLLKEFNAITKSFTGVMAIVYIFFFLFPTSLIDETYTDKKTQRSAEGRTVLSDIKLYEGDQWFFKLVEVRRKYIQRFGYEKYIQIFGEQMRPIEGEIILYEKKQQQVEFEKETIEKEKELILYSEYGKSADTIPINR